MDKSMTKTLTEKLDEAAKKAKEAVLNKPKKKTRKKSEPKTDEQKATEKRESSGWVDDNWGTQGCVYHTGGKYWLTKMKEGNFVYVPITEEQWEERKKEAKRTNKAKEKKNE
jgi:hypothetical protein